MLWLNYVKLIIKSTNTLLLINYQYTIYYMYTIIIINCQLLTYQVMFQKVHKIYLSYNII